MLSCMLTFKECRSKEELQLCKLVDPPRTPIYWLQNLELVHFFLEKLQL